ncbi:amino acid ABC transporter permease [Devosia sp.]|uniref:amino acid ABC transporter permease n=1 Tax=Devosia sp. TaxID=1871048 RepID=UPI003BAB8AD6
MAMQDAVRQAPPRTSLFNDPAIRGIIYQVVVIALVVGGGAWLVLNAIQNLAAQGKNMGFEFLTRTSGFDIGFSVIDFDRTSTYWEVFVVGLLNTLLASFISIILATILGFFLGIARLSKNWIVAKMAMVYVEVTRNIPLLLWLFVIYFAVLKTLPPVKTSMVVWNDFYLNQRGIFVPKLVFDERFVWVLGSVLVAIVAAFGVRQWAKQRLFATGKRFPTLIVAILILIAIPAITFLASGSVINVDPPVLSGFNFKGGIDIPPELAAMIVGLTLYTATFIGEIVRSGIQAVSHGQTEAAQSLGLRDGDRLRLVVLPQAMRVVIPPLTSEYLSLTKNSSLGAAIGYPELVNVFAGTALNQTGKAFEIIGMTMLVYLIFSLVTSAFMNWFNARVALVER